MPKQPLISANVGSRRSRDECWSVRAAVPSSFGAVVVFGTVIVRRGRARFGAFHSVARSSAWRPRSGYVVSLPALGAWPEVWRRRVA
ncbi:hypothetical protein SAMN05444320_105198 [Streptoalloteichus hindustanus]|uniref:Uncharacterized protein n=1 Tax=Streptoalloteichus hindustanus TaxID=2017 RepID=A0A1M5EYR7_STRHI|nr:hypothetical protein SAMN05444320_105198 [Streptoalloteichus hindustanus]